ncbi:MAG TPA: hypothetical protein VIH76_02075 [Candidatus Acidoferrales bacterium]
MGSFTSSVLANFLGSLLAGTALALTGYYLITRRYQIIQPRQDRIKEETLVCSLLMGELERAKEFVDRRLTGMQTLERLQMHAWDALKGSQAIRFLPIGCLEPVLRAYSDLYVLEYMFLKVEDAQMKDFETGNSGVMSGAARLGKMISDGVRNRLLQAQKNCADAIGALASEAERLKASL